MSGFRIVTPYMFLRLVQEEDASFILKIRMDPNNARFISPTSPHMEDQIAFIKACKERERAGNDFFFIACLPDGTPFGTYRIHDFNGPIFTIGSWVVDRNVRQPKLSILIDVLMRLYAFQELKFTTCFFGVKKENKKVNAYHIMFGAVFEYDDDEGNFYTIKKDVFLKHLLKLTLLKIIEEHELDYRVVNAIKICRTRLTNL